MELGKYELNKIYNEDCYEAIKKIPDKSIDLIVTDPPYQFDMGGGGGHFGTKERNYHAEYLSLYHQTGTTKETEKLRIRANAQNNANNYRFISRGFDYELLDEFVRVMKKVNIYIWCSKAQVSKILTYFEELGCNTDIITWHKTNPTPTINNTYANDTEYCIFAREKGVKVYGSYETKKKWYVSPANVDDKKQFTHPTIKPLEIIKNLIINSSVEGEVVLDVFMGSGTTAVACKELNRNFIGFEIDEKYFKIANDRVNGITANGQTSIFTDFENL